LVRSAEHSSVRLKAVVDDLRRQSELITAASDHARIDVGEVGLALHGQADDLSRIAGESSELLKAFGQQLRQNAAELSDTVEQAQLQARSSGDALRQCSREFEETAGKTTAQVTTTADQLKSGIRDLASSSDRITAQVRGAGESLRRQAQELSEATERSAAQLEDIFEMLRQKSSDLGMTGERLSNQTDTLVQRFGRQAEELVAASRAAEIQTKELEQQRSDVSIENFLQNAAYIVEKLQSISVDISRIFQAGIDDKTWREFHSGDQSIFLRKILKNLDRNQIAAIRTRYEEDGQFRDYVNRYLAEFEVLLAKARTADRADVLTGTFTSAEVGKLYLVLARAMGRLE
jgi:ABC-type transporter Mla subunit MlaD